MSVGGVDRIALCVAEAAGGECQDVVIVILSRHQRFGDLVQHGEAAYRRLVGGNQEPVVSVGIDRADSAHRIRASSVGEEPLRPAVQGRSGIDRACISRRGWCVGVS